MHADFPQVFRCSCKFLGPLPLAAWVVLCIWGWMTPPFPSVTLGYVSRNTPIAVICIGAGLAILVYCQWVKRSSISPKLRMLFLGLCLAVGLGTHHRYEYYYNQWFEKLNGELKLVSLTPGAIRVRNMDTNHPPTIDDLLMDFGGKTQDVSSPGGELEKGRELAWLFNSALVFILLPLAGWLQIALNELCPRITILLLGANPADQEQLTLEKERREIERKIASSDRPDAIKMVVKLTVRPDDLLQYLNQYRPQIVHFSGHGTPNEELLVLDQEGNSKAITGVALKGLFVALKDNVRVVMLNACYSRPQAEAITEVIDFAIGMSREISDDGAIIFAASFYRAIGFGHSVQNAFDQGKEALMLEGIPEENTPMLLSRTGVDPRLVYLVVY